VACALPSDKLALHQLEFPFRDRRRLSQTVAFEVEGEIPFDLEDVVVDWQIVGGEGKSSVVASVLAQRRDISQLLDQLAMAQCEPRILEAEGMVLGNLASIFDLSGRRLLVDIGHTRTTLCLMMEGQAVASRCFRVGARHVTEAIAGDLGWSIEDAERWKCEDGIFTQSLDSRAPGALQVLDRIAREIVLSLDSMERILGGMADTQLDCLTLLGGGALLHRIDEYLTGRTGIVAGYLGQPPKEDDAALVAGGDSALFAPALALALRSTARASTRMNFRQDEFSYRTDLTQFVGKDMRGTAVLAGVTALLLGTSVAVSAALESGQAGQLDSEIEQIYSSAMPGTPVPSNPVAAMNNALQSARQRADFLGVYAGNRSALDLLTELSRRIPTSLDVIFEEITIDPKVIRIKASGTNFEAADRVLAELAREAPFEQARITGETKKVKDRIVFNVTVSLNLRGDEA
jgi:general secretion pathway protein L